MDWRPIAVSFPIGLLTSGLAWWALLRIFTPRLAISKIAKAADAVEPSGYEYRIKVLNRSRRSMVSVTQVNARLSARGLDPRRPLNRPGIVVSCGTTPIHPVITPRDGRIYTLHIDDLDGSASLALIPPRVRRRLKKMTLEDMLHLTDDVQLRFYITAAHGKSGFQRTYAVYFTEEDIVIGRFRKGAVEIVPMPLRLGQ